MSPFPTGAKLGKAKVCILKASEMFEWCRGRGRSQYLQTWSVLALINAGAAPGFVRVGSSWGVGGGWAANPAGSGQNLLLACQSYRRGGFPGRGLTGGRAAAEGGFRAGGRGP